ncbi:MAG: transposase [Acidobacteria bacterium]|nr:transposase [Acidobacteriota bacterium]
MLVSKSARKNCSSPSAARGRRFPLRSFPNSPESHRALAHYLAGPGWQVRVCLESTGVSGLDLALLLHAQEGIAVLVANPRAVRHLAQALMQRSKTDPLDGFVAGRQWELPFQTGRAEGGQLAAEFHDWALLLRRSPVRAVVRSAAALEEPGRWGDPMYRSSSNPRAGCRQPSAELEWRHGNPQERVFSWPCGGIIQGE